MSRSVKIAAWIGGVLLVLVSSAAIMLFVVPNTDRGRAFLIQGASRWTGGKVRLVGLHGRFPAAVDLDRVELSDAGGVWLWAEHVALRWSPRALLTRHIDIASLHVALLHVDRAPVADQASSSSAPLSVPDTDLKDLTIGTLELGEKLTGHLAALTVQGRAHLRSLDDADLRFTASRIAGDGQYLIEGHFDRQSLNATVQLHEPAHGPLAALVQWPDAGAIAVQATLAGPREAEDLKLTASVGPMQASAEGRVDLDGQSTDVRYSLRAPAMSPVEGVQWQTIALQGELHGPWKRLEAQGSLRVAGLQAPGGARVAVIDGRLAGDQGVLHVLADVDGLRIPGSSPRLLEDSRLNVDATVHLDDPARPLALAVTHRLFALNASAVTTGAQSADLTLHLPDLRPFGPWSGAKLRGDAQLAAHVDYSPASTRVTAHLSTRVDGGEAAWAGVVRGGVTEARLSASLTEQRLAVTDLRVTAPGGALTGHGTTERRGDQAIRARFDANVPDLHRISAALAGTLAVSGSLDGPGSRLTVDTRLRTTLSVHGSPSAGLSARIQASGLPQSPNGVIDAQGDLDGAPLRINSEIQSGRSGEYRAIIRRADWKSAHAEGDVTVKHQEAAGSAAFRLGDLSDLNRLLGQQLGGTVAGELVLATESHRPRVHLEVDARQIQASAFAGNARLEADGPTQALQITLDVDSPGIAGSPAKITAAAVLNLDAKDLALNRLQASYHEQQLQLLNPASVHFANEVMVHQLNLGIEEASLSLDGQVAPTLDFRASVKNVRPALVNAFVPNLLASGRADADATIRGTAAAPSGSIRLQALNLRAKSADARGLPPTDLRTQVTLREGTADLDASLTAGTDSHLALTGRSGLSAGSDVDLKLAGTIDLALANPILEAAGRRVSGAVQVDTRVSGTSMAPHISGAVRISNGSVRDYAQGLSLTDISGELSGDQGDLRIEQLTARAAPGTITLQGTMGVLQPGLPVDLHLSAKNAQPVASNLFTANLNADLQVSGRSREDLEIKGGVHLNHAEINIPGGLPPDVAVLDVERDGVPPASASRQALVTHLHVDVDAPNRILIKGRGLDAELGGSLHVTGTAQMPRVDGGFELQRGFFTLANSKLRFSAGTVTFNGSGLQQKLDPSLDFTAQSKAAEVTATVHITGLADAPQIALSSSPELPQDEVLARLLFGQPAAQLSALELVETGVALASLRGGGNGPSLNPIDRVQKALGLDRLSVGSGSNPSGASTPTESKSETTVEAGRYVSSRVYVGVKEGTAGSSQVDVDIDLTRNLKLQAQLGNGSTTAQGVTPENDPGSSLGLAYTFEY